MLKFLLTILLISAGVRIVTGNGLFMHSVDLEKICLQDEEDGNEKAEKKETKQIVDESFHLYYPTYYRLPDGAGCHRIPLRHHKPYHRFIDRPNTPPPDPA